MKQLIKGQFSKYTSSSSRLSIKKTNNTRKKMGERPNVLPKMTYRLPTNCEKILNINHYYRNANKNYNETLPHTCQNGHHQKLYKQ